MHLAWSKKEKDGEMERGKTDERLKKIKGIVKAERISYSTPKEQ